MKLVHGSIWTLDGEILPEGAEQRRAILMRSPGGWMLISHDTQRATPSVSPTTMRGILDAWRCVDDMETAQDRG